MFGNRKAIRELNDLYWQMYKENKDFLIYAHKVLQNVQDQSKRKYMYELQQEDIELIEDGKKIRKIRKIIE